MDPRLVDCNIAFLRRRARVRRHACAWLCLFGASPVLAQIYSSGTAGPDGSVTLSNFASPSTPVLLLPPELPATDPASPTPAVAEAIGTGRVRPPVARPLPPSTAALISSIARDYAVAETLVKAVIAAESGFDPNARSNKGAMGLMQLMPETARRYGVRNAYAVEENLRAGTAYLRRLLDLYAGDVTLALAAYNAGEGAVSRAGLRIPDIAETRAYVPKVLSYQAHYGAEARRASPAMERVATNNVADNRSAQ